MKYTNYRIGFSILCAMILVKLWIDYKNNIINLVFPIIAAVSLYGMITVDNVCRMKFFNNIMKYGKTYDAILVECETPFFYGRGINILLRSFPVVKFTVMGETITMSAFGYYRDKPCNINGQLQVKYWEENPEYQDYVIISGKINRSRYFNSLIRVNIYFLIFFIAFIASLTM